MRELTHASFQIQKGSNLTLFLFTW